MKTKKFFLLFLVMLFVTFAKAQVGIDQKYNCVVVDHFTLQERMNKYPFNKADHIKLISFKSETLSLPLKNGIIDLTKVKCSLTLTSTQIDSLSDILFNVGCKSDTIHLSVSYAIGIDVAILFYDSSNHLIDYTPLCFDCFNYNISTNKVVKTLGVPCNQKFEMLKSFIRTTNLQL